MLHDDTLQTTAEETERGNPAPLARSGRFVALVLVVLTIRFFPRKGWAHSEFVRMILESSRRDSGAAFGDAEKKT
jgi:hypothetical protein